MAEANSSHPRIIVDGISVIESTNRSSEAYLLPEIIGVGMILPMMSMCSISSSVYAETGAPDIRHLESRSTCSIEEEEEEQGQMEMPRRQLSEESGHVLHLLSSNSPASRHIYDKDGRGHEVIVTTTFEDDAPSYTSLPVKIIQDIDRHSEESFEVVSAITLSDFSIHPRPMFGFSQSLMPEQLTPRKRHNWTRNSNSKERHRQHHHLSVVPSTPSRYQRPVDSLLTQQEHVVPSSNESRHTFTPIPTHARLRGRRPSDWIVDANQPTALTSMKMNRQIESESSRAEEQSCEPCDIGSCCENVDPRSPVVRRRKEKKDNGMATGPPTKRPETPQDVLRARCDYCTDCAKT